MMAISCADGFKFEKIKDFKLPLRIVRKKDESENESEISYPPQFSINMIQVLFNS